ncbi:MAG TPA: hypothetical protein VEF36_01295 [Roseiarcus sp.]|nr:hypothetical protein [Roseiarcus sp.]
METKLCITLRDVYGQVKAYPACQQSRLLADMLGTKTLTLAALHGAAAMGFTLVYVDRFGASETWSAKAFALRIA